MKTKEVEELLSISKHSLMYYEKEGFIKPQRLNNNYRDYSLEDIETLRFVLLLRSMDLSIDTIKLIIQGQLNIRDALIEKEDYLKKQHLELQNIQEKIQEYIKRHRVKISFDEDDTSSLLLKENSLQYDQLCILLKDIQKVKVSMCSEVYNTNLFNIHMLYYVDIDIETAKDTYSFQIMNERKTIELFDYFHKYQIPLDDPLSLDDIYHQYRDDVQRNKYINHHFRDWAKKYHLDNPRVSSHYTDRLKSRIDDMKKMARHDFHKIHGR